MRLWHSFSSDWINISFGSKLQWIRFGFFSVGKSETSEALPTFCLSWSADTDSMVCCFSVSETVFSLITAFFKSASIFLILTVKLAQLAVMLPCRKRSWVQIPAACGLNFLPPETLAFSKSPKPFLLDQLLSMYGAWLQWPSQSHDLSLIEKVWWNPLWVVQNQTSENVTELKRCWSNFLQNDESLMRMESWCCRGFVFLSPLSSWGWFIF